MNRFSDKTWPLALSVLMPLTAVGCNKKAEEPARVPEVAEAAPDGSYVAISGRVVQTQPEELTLDYGPGVITVEMNDWKWSAADRALLLDDTVVVHGFVDDDFYEQRTIEATSLYSRDLGTEFLIDGPPTWPAVSLVEAEERPMVSLTGVVEDVDQEEFELRSGESVIAVDTREMPIDPLDDEGFQKVRQGDRVRVTGNLEDKLFEGLELTASTVVSLR